ncbi:hypothetical protein BO78DRAFT_382023 [Aspergillus sclerotiicarbonarius CBS 121057]|uniref:F-box domain-containing protein n=1 Tax=Aspergillus sclerotiicarbonarius (strain CBS 121057 / IBT 28362) TaxID=1448318 RepID=A0A319ENS4_ASPSB|nr:hypothetical protein BO78DRAFT_382023 [Aspergillus sclerotiicarbonarius CBS 121057]
MDRPSSTRIFFIPELLEAILLDVDLRTLLTSAQRVCYFWHCVIRDSTPLQEKLFFKPMSPTSQHHQTPTRNPLIESDLWHCLKMTQLQVNDIWDPYMRHPYFSRAEICGRPEASWRHMLLQQPPTSEIATIHGYNVILPENRDNPSYDPLRMHHLDYAVQCKLIGPVMAKDLPLLQDLTVQNMYMPLCIQKIQNASSSRLRNYDVILYQPTWFGPKTIHKASNAMNDHNPK